MGLRQRMTSSVLRVSLGLLTVGVGVALLLLAPGSTALVTTLAGAGLVVAGVAALTGHAPAGRAPVRGVVVAVLFVVLGVVALAWRDVSVRVLALVLGVGLAVHGVDGLVDAWRRRDPDRVWRGLTGATSLVLAVLVAAWPRLTLHVVALLVGAWLVLVGLRTALARPASRPGRRRAARLRTGAAFVVAALALAGTLWLHDGDRRVVPDGFYVPPASVPATAGELIRHEPLATGVPDGLRAWRILYTTTDGEGEPAVASGTVLAPSDAAEPMPVIAVGHGTTGVVPRCAPSLSAEPFADGASAALEQVVRSGRVAVLTDYVGLGTAGPHAYLVGPDAAHAVLDAVRAAHQLSDVQLTDQVVAWGHSQGGHAALWTGILAGDHAPELDLVGVAAFAPASDLHALADGVRSELAGKLVSAYIASSWDAAYPELEVRSQLTVGYGAVVDRIADLCFTGRDVLAALTASTQLSREVFVPGALDGPIGERLRANSPDGDIAAPVLIAQGDADPLVRPAEQTEYVRERCAAGQSVDYRLYDDLDHLSLVADDSPLTDDVVRWTEDRLAGEPAVTTCPD